MSPEARQKLLSMLLPSLLVAIVWGLYLRPTAKLNTARTELQAATASEPKEVDFVMANNAATKSREELAAVTKEFDEWNARWQRVKSDRIGKSPNRIVGIENITRIFENSSLQIVREVSLDGTTNVKLPPELESQLKKLSEKGSTVKTEFWRIDFVGKYRDVAMALGRVAVMCPMAVPMSLSMHDDHNGYHVWSLDLWL
jgi:hypothetical protein